MLAAPATGCSRSTEPASPATQRTSDASRLVGSWDLIRACGGLAGNCLTPSALAEPTRYVFRTDGMVEAYRDGALRFVTNYQLVPPPANDPDGRSVLMIGFGPAIDPRPLYATFPDDDSLLLDEGCCDRYAFEYRRAK